MTMNSKVLMFVTGVILAAPMGVWGESVVEAIAIEDGGDIERDMGDEGRQQQISHVNKLRAALRLKAVDLSSPYEPLLAIRLRKWKAVSEELGKLKKRLAEAEAMTPEQRRAASSLHGTYGAVRRQDPGVMELARKRGALDRKKEELASESDSIAQLAISVEVRRLEEQVKELEEETGSGAGGGLANGSGEDAGAAMLRGLRGLCDERQKMVVGFELLLGEIDVDRLSAEKLMELAKEESKLYLIVKMSGGGEAKKKR